MKKRLLAVLISLLVFLALFAGFDYLSHLHRAPSLITAIRQQWNDYKDQWKERHDGRPEVLPSPTPHPMLGEEARHTRLVELFRSNGGCRFPCWWGIVPGKTSWEEVHALLSTFMDSETHRYLSDDRRRLFTSGYYYYGFDIAIEVPVLNDDPVSNVLVSDVPSEYLSNLSIANIFQNYGMPDEIYIRSPHGEIGYRTCVGEFELFIYYPSEQFAVLYRYQSYAIRQTIQVCGLDRPTYAEFYVWAPASSSDFQSVAGRANWYPVQDEIRTIEEATDWTTASFYAAFQSRTGSSPCVVAPPFEWKYAPNLYSWCEKKSP